MKDGPLRTRDLPARCARPLAPDLPTVAESGNSGYAFDSWWGLSTNAGVPHNHQHSDYETRRVLQLPRRE
jgi:tripartite-type tricarboxylate transporter receptor subunit TctC